MDPIDRRLVCRSCGARPEPDAARWRCGACDGTFDLEPMAVTFPRDRIAMRPATMWRYVEALPYPPDGTLVRSLSLGEGMTPLVPHRMAGVEVQLKLDFLMPTLSFKDRGAVVLVARAVEAGARELIADSSGNAGTAISAYAARAGLPITVYVRAGTSAHKLAQMRAHGATVVEVAGSREDVAAAAMAAVDARRAFYASHVYDPSFLEGTKTFGFEVWEQLGWSVPDVIVLPVGNGTLVLGVARAFEELLAAGEIERLPRLVAVQAAGCTPIARAFAAGEARVAPVASTGTVADGIAIAAPARGDQILDAVRRFDGRLATVEDHAVLEAARDLAGRGLFVEPTAAAPVAGLAACIADGTIRPTETVVVPLTGAGLKTA